MSTTDMKGVKADIQDKLQKASEIGREYGMKAAVGLEKAKESVLKAKQAAKDKLEDAQIAYQTEKGVFVYNIVNILGEQVSFIPTGLSPQETAIVPFDEYYRPEGISNEDNDILKKTMRIVFSQNPNTIKETDTGTELPKKDATPYPPCGEREKFLVLASLLHRVRKLRQQLYELGILTPQQLMKGLKEADITQGRNSALARNYLLHLHRLQEFIDEYNQQQKCIDIGDIAYGDIDLDLNDERTKELLKQFVFFILQSHYPLKDYRTRDPTAPGFIKRLEKNPLKDEFPLFLKAYQATGSPIPPPIAKVLEATDIDNETMKKEVNRLVENETKKILDGIAKLFPAGDPFLTFLESTKDPVLVVDKLRVQIKEYENRVRLLTSEKANLEKKLKACDDAKALLFGEKKRLEQQILTLETALKKEQGKDAVIKQLQDEKAALQADFNKRLAAVNQQRDKILADFKLKDAEAKAALTTNQALLDRIQEVDQEVARLTKVKEDADRDIVALKQKHLNDLAAKDREIETSRRLLDEQTKIKDDLQRTLLATQEELSAADGGLVIATGEVERLEKEIEELRTKLAEVSDGVTSDRTKIEEKENEIQRLNSELAKLQTTMEEKENEMKDLEEDIAKEQASVGLLRTDAETARKTIDDLRQQLEDAKTKAHDCEVELANVRSVKESLESKASAGDLELSRLKGALEAAEKERELQKDDLAKQQEVIKSLGTELNEEKKKTSDLDTQGKQKNTKIRQLETDLAGSQNNLQRATDELEKTRDEKEAAKETVGELVKQIESMSADSQMKTLQEKQKLKDRFDAQLRETKEAYEDLMKKSAKGYEHLQEIVTQIANAIDSGADISIGDTPEAPALEKIVGKLKSKGSSTASSALSLVTDSSLNHCYLVFLTSFLWKTHLNVPPTQYATADEGKFAHSIRTIISSTFNGGEDKKVASTAVAKSSGTKTSIPGIYADYGCGGVAKGAEDCYCKETDICALIKPSQEATTIKRYLDLVGRLLQYMPEAELTKEMIDFEKHGTPEEEEVKEYSTFEKFTPPKAKEAKSRVPSDLELLMSLQTKLKEFSFQYFGVSFTQDEKDNSWRKLPHYSRLLLQSVQPTIDKTMSPVLRRSVMIFDDKVYVQQKEERKNDPSVLNYAVLFYVYLVLMRDYLFRVEQTGRTQCELPTILRK